MNQNRTKTCKSLASQGAADSGHFSPHVTLGNGLGVWGADFVSLLWVRLRSLGKWGPASLWLALLEQENSACLQTEWMNKRKHGVTL
jgi:hypothetical protein